jgi:hypothetical protein
MYCLQLRLTHYSEGNFVLHVTALSAQQQSAGRSTWAYTHESEHAGGSVACVCPWIGCIRCIESSNSVSRCSLLQAGFSHAQHVRWLRSVDNSRVERTLTACFSCVVVTALRVCVLCYLTLYAHTHRVRTRVSNIDSAHQRSTHAAIHT